jgi:hypothetical protein
MLFALGVFHDLRHSSTRQPTADSRRQSASMTQKSGVVLDVGHSFRNPWPAAHGGRSPPSIA